MKWKRKGSLTVEASIAFTVFISAMFLLLNLVKLILFMIILNNAAVESAKTIATVGYPISFLNEAQSGIEKKEEYLKGDKLSGSAISLGEGTALAGIFGSSPREMIKTGATDYLKNVLMGKAVDILKGEIYTVKGNAVKGLAGWFIKGSLDSTGFAFDPERMYLRMVKIPVTEAEYKAIYTEPFLLSDKGTLQAVPSSQYDGRDDGDFNGEDVVICLEYPVRLVLPFLDDVSLTLRSTAVEHAWLNSTCGGPKRTEGIDLNNLLFGKDVMVAVATGGYGKCYHKPGCITLWELSHKVPKEPFAAEHNVEGDSVRIARTAAQKQGFTPCKRCKPDNLEPGEETQ